MDQVKGDLPKFVRRCDRCNGLGSRFHDLTSAHSKFMTHRRFEQLLIGVEVQQRGQDGTGRLSKEGDRAGVSAKGPNVVLYPFEAFFDVSQTEVGDSSFGNFLAAPGVSGARI